MKLEDLNVNNQINLEEYFAFYNLVKKSMKHPDWLGDFTVEKLQSMLEVGTKIYVYSLDEPICSMMLIPSTEKDIKKFNLNLDYKEVVDYGPMFVNPKYIGNNLQFQMLKEIDKLSLKKEYKYVVTTVHTENNYSINNLLKSGFVLIGTRKFNRGVRNIYLKELNEVK